MSISGNCQSNHKSVNILLGFYIFCFNFSDSVIIPVIKEYVRKLMGLSMHYGIGAG